MKNVELKQTENIFSSAINKNLTETIAYTDLASVNEGKFIVSVISYFKNLQDLETVILLYLISYNKILNWRIKFFGSG